MAESARLLLELRAADGPRAARLLQALRHQLGQPLTAAHLDLIILNLLSTSEQNSLNLIDFIKKKFIDQSYVDSICEAFGILAKILEGSYKTKFEKYIENIVSASLTVLRSACAAKVKEKCLLPLDAIVHHPSAGNWSEPISNIIEVLSIHIVKKSEKPTVLAKEFELMGSLCKLYPEQIRNLSDSIGKSFLQTIEEAIEGKAKISLPLLEGCFKGLVGYMDKFFDLSMSDIIYRGIKKFANPGDQHRRGHARATLRIINKHGIHFNQQLQADFKYWHILLIKWINQNNTDDKQAAYGALFSFYTNVGESLMNAGRCSNTMLCLEYFMNYFNTILSDKFGKNVELSIVSTSYEVKYALKGFTTLISKCKAFYDIKEYHQISEIIMQRAILLYQDNSNENISITRQADENATEKIEELCIHIEALAAIGVNVDRNLENLVCILISDFQKCLNHRQYIVINTIKQAVKVVDLQIVVSHLIKESCRHSICSNLYYNVKSNNNVYDYKITYETFIPLWRGIFEIEDNEISSRICDEFITVIISIFPKLDLSTKNIPINDLYHNNQENETEFNDLETFEIPECPHDYRYFTNVCDLFATILLQTDTNERFIKWIEPIVEVLVKGRRTEPTVGGYLRIAEAVLKMIKSLDVFSDTAQYNVSDENMDLERKITELISDLSMMTTGLFQLRSALVFIQAPPQILNSELVVKACSVFEVIFRVGKTNLYLAFNALDVLEEWNAYLEINSFRIICKSVIPILNDYLCSSGITDINALDINKVPKYKYKQKKNKNKNVGKEIYPQLTTLQHKIILFMAKVDSDAIQNLLNPLQFDAEDYSNMDNDNVIYMIEKLKMSIPYSSNRKLDIYLDTLVPRIKDVALQSTNRDTRLTACQTLHSIILLMYGTVVTMPSSQKSSMANVQKQLITAMLYLAADSDEAVSSMFAPLLKQSCHWLAIAQNNQESANFITALLNEIGNSSSTLICEMACQAIKEFTSWTIKKSTVEQLENVPLNISAILRTICQMMLHPEDNQRRGSCMLLIYIMPQIYIVDSAIDKFLPELIYCVVKCIDNTMRDQKRLLSSKINAELGLKSLDKVLICLVKKGYIFKKRSVKRRIPTGFGNALLDEIAIWLLSTGKDGNRDVAEKCVKAFKNICTIHYKDRSTDPLNNSMTKDGDFIKKYLEFDSILIDECYDKNDINSFTDNLQKIFISIDAYLLVMNHSIIENDILFKNTENNIISVIKSFLKMINIGSITEIYNNLSNNSTEINLDSKSAKMKKIRFNKLIYETSWKVYEFSLIVQPLDYSITKEFITSSCDDLMTSLFGWIDDPQKLSLMTKYSNQRLGLNDIIRRLKLDARVDWTQHEDRLIASLINCLSTISINGINHPDLKNRARHLNCLSDVIDLIDSKRKLDALTTLDCSKIITTIIDSLFVVNFSNLYIAELDSSVVHSIGDILTFILRAKCIDQKKILEIIIDDTSVMCLNQSLPKRILNRGGYSSHIFRSQLFTYIIENYVDVFNIVIDDVCELNHGMYILLLENIMKYISEKGNIGKDSVGEFCKNLITILEKLWPKFVSWDVTFDTLFQLFSLLTITLSADMYLIGTRENNLTNWLLATLNDKSIEIEKKNKLIVLLPTILKPGTSIQWYDEYVSNALTSLKDCLPLSCHDYMPNTKNRSEYINVIRSILDAMANSGSYVLLQNVLPLCIVDNDHICEEHINRKVKLFITRLSDNHQLEVLQEVFNMTNSEIDTGSLFNLINRFLIPLLLSSSSNAVESFFINNISSLFDLMNKKISLNFSQFQVEHIFVEWIGTFKILETMFLKVPFENLDSAGSKIASSVYGSDLISHKLVKDVFTAAFKMRSIEVPTGVSSENATEFLRLAHCSAFKCLYAITLVKPKVDKKFYMVLINHKSTASQRFWEGMIDLKKEYNFPIKTDQIVKEKNYSIASKAQNLDILTVNGMTFQDSLNLFSTLKIDSVKNDVDNRHSFITQTLTENIFKYDLNTAVIRDSFDQTTANHKMKQVSKVVQTSVSLTENDINSHECMATVCKLLTEIDEITRTDADDDNIVIPDWIKCVSDLLSDTNRNKNVRLFMAHVIDNTRDICKRYSKILFLPILSVIEDRCTGFNPQINYLDVCLISTLLSWKNTILPESRNQILSASKVLRFLINEIDSSLQNIFKHSLELLNTILSVWGKYLMIPYDLLIEKLEGDISHKGAGIQIVASILMNDIVPWENFVMYERYKNVLLSTLKSEHKDFYKSTAEVIGLTLKMLSDKPNESEIFEALLTDVRSVISKFYDVNRDKFIICIYNVQIHFNNVCDDTVLPKIVFLIPRVSEDLKKKSFEMFLNSMDVLSDKNLYGELLSLGIEDFVKDFDFQISALHIINKAINRLTSSQIIKLIKDLEYLCSLSNHTDKECRAVVYEILIKLYTCEFSEQMIIDTKYDDDSNIFYKKRPYCEDNIIHTINNFDDENHCKKYIKSSLLQGLDDDDNELKMKIFKFWTEQFSTNLHERIVEVFREFFNDKYNIDSKLLGCLLRVIISTCWKSSFSLEEKLFQNPLEVCDYTDYDWKATVDKQEHVLAPMYAETLNSQLLVSSMIENSVNGNSASSRDAKMLRSTISLNNNRTFVDFASSVVNDSLKNIDQTLTGNNIWNDGTLQRKQNKHSFENTFSLGTESSFLFSVEPQRVNFNTYKPLSRNQDDKDDDEFCESITKKFRKHFVAGKKLQAIKFSGLASYKQKLNEEKHLFKKPLDSFKRFRQGDYPDVQFSLKDLLFPLMELAARDTILAKELFIIIFKALKSMPTFNEESTSNGGSINVENFRLSSAKFSLQFLKYATKYNLDTTLVHALLEICQQCLNECREIIEFDAIIKDSAKLPGAEWLGTLVMEEKQILDASMIKRSAKRFKIDCNIEQRCNVIEDQIYKHRLIGNWTEIQNILETATQDDLISDDKKLGYTKESLECLAQLSNWDDLIEFVGFQISSNDSDTTSTLNSFNYDRLWTKSWIKNFLLPLIFDANVHRLSTINQPYKLPKIDKTTKDLITEHSKIFDVYINEWMNDDEKYTHLNTNLSSKLAIWKTIYKLDHNPLAYINNAVDYSRVQWIHEFQSRNNMSFNCYTKEKQRNSSLHVMQLMGEIYNLSELPLLSGVGNVDAGNSSLKTLMKTWKNCVPVNNDDTILWDLRLACRSIFAHRLQNAIKSQTDSEDFDECNENQEIIKSLGQTQRYAELCLVKTAIDQLNYSLADKFINKHCKNLDPEDEITWALQYTNSLKIRIEHETDVDSKLRAIFKVWKTSEETRTSYKCADDPFSYVELLKNAADMSLKIHGVLKSCCEKNVSIDRSDLNENLIEIISMGEVFQEPLADNVMNPEMLGNTLIKYSELYLNESIEISENHMKSQYDFKNPLNINDIIYDALHESKPLNFVSNAYLTMAKYCRNVINENLIYDDIDSLSNLVVSLLRAMKYGNNEARKMFPILFIEFERLPPSDEVFSIFKNEILSIPCWLFLPWVSQLLAYMPKFHNILTDLIVRISEIYPQSIVHQYRLSKRMWINMPASDDTKDKSFDAETIIKRLDLILQDENIEIFVKALSGVCEPNTLLKIHLENVLKATNEDCSKVTWDKAFEELFEEVFPVENVDFDTKLRGSIFKQLKSTKNILETIWKSGTSHKQILKGRIEINKFLQTQLLEKRSSANATLKSIRDFSPYLASYGETSISMVEVFGQYGKFNTSMPIPKNHVTIVKFDSEVMVIGSLRRPIRVRVIGSDGVKYSFLVKRGEDLRQDERIQQLFGLMNDYLYNDGMKINTYKVTPLTWDLGLIEWINNCPRLRDVLTQFNTDTKVLIDNAKLERIRCVQEVPGNTLGEKFGNMAANISEYQKSYNTIVEKIPKYLLRDAFVKLAVSPDKFVHMRNNYIKSLAPMNISHWILGIGDRHLSNCLVSLNTGSVIGIDFGHAFGTATQLIGVPEMLPFRLTPQFLGVLAPDGAEGNLRRLMIASLRCFVDNSTLLLAAMEVFVHEPAMNWLQSINKADDESVSSCPIGNIKLCQWSPRSKIDQCKKKLSGINPISITLEDLRIRTGDKFIESYAAVAKNSAMYYNPCTEQQELLSVSQQVNCLINQATNSGILAITYFGWEPWI